MIKALGVRAGRPLLVLGLSAQDCARLQEGNPISLDLRELGLRPFPVMIFGGRTEGVIVADLRRAGWLGADFPPIPGEPS